MCVCPLGHTFSASIRPLCEKLEDIKGVIRIAYRRTDNTMAKKKKITKVNTNTTKKTKDRAT